jgi:hypothetical protein
MPLSAADLRAVATLWRRTGRRFTTSFLGTSMLPTIAPGTPVEVDCGRTPQAGDVIAFAVAGQVFVHRIELTSPDGRHLLTRGDNRIIPDLPIEADAVIGVVGAPALGPQSSLRRSFVLALTRRSFLRDPGRTRRVVHLLRMAGAVLTLGRSRLLQLARIEPPLR